MNSLIQAVDTYEDSNLVNKGSITSELMRDGVIQRFEYTFELSWKTLKRYLEVYGLENPDGFTNKQLFRVGFENGFIRDSEIWLKFLHNRNLTSHTYNENIAEEVYKNAKLFIKEVKFLFDKLQEKIKDDQS